MAEVIFFGVVNSGDTVTDSVGLSVHNNGASSVSVSISLVGKNIVHSTTNLWHTGGESRRAGSESTCGGEGCGGDEEELHGCYS
jgi:hypothetical protein